MLGELGVQETGQPTGTNRDGERDHLCSEIPDKNSINEQKQEPSELHVPERDQNEPLRSKNDCKTNKDYFKALKNFNALETNHNKYP